MNVCKITLKGKALVLAVDSGLIKKNILGRCDITPFLRFWDGFLPLLKETLDEGEDINYMLCNHGDDSAQE